MTGAASLWRLSLEMVAFLTLLPATVGAEKNCDVEPLRLPLQGMPVTYEVNSQGHAVKLQRTPHEKFILLDLGHDADVSGPINQVAVGISTQHNATFVPDTSSVCENEILRACRFLRAGNYSPQRSSNFKTDDGKSESNNGTASNAGYYRLNTDRLDNLGEQADASSLVQRGWEKVRFYTGYWKAKENNMTIDGYPLSVIKNKNFPLDTGSIGLATHSTFLDTMVKTGNAPARSFGLISGTETSDMPAELVVGGYNIDRVNSYTSFTNFTVNADPSIPCPLQVKVKRVSVDGQTSKYPGFVYYDEPFTACIDPGQATNYLPLNFRKEWIDFIGGPIGPGLTESETYWDSIQFQKDSDDELTTSREWENMMNHRLWFELEGGFTAKVPLKNLMDSRGRPELDFHYPGASSMPLVYNSSFLVTHFGDGRTNNRDPIYNILGRSFLSEIYLAVNYEDMVFGLAECSSATCLRDWVVDAKMHKLGCDASGPKEGPPKEEPPKQENSMDSDKTSSNKGAIIGGAVGGAVGALLLAGALVFFLRRRKAHMALSGAQDVSNTEKITAHPGPQLQHPGIFEADSREGYGGYMSPAELCAGTEVRAAAEMDASGTVPIAELMGEGDVVSKLNK